MDYPNPFEKNQNKRKACETGKEVDDSIMKRMKWIVCICLVLAFCLSLCACGAVSDENINSFLRSLSKSEEYNDFDATKSVETLTRCLKNDSFPQLLNQYLMNLITSGDYDSAVQLISHLEGLQYPTDDLTAILDASILGELDKYSNIKDINDVLDIIRHLCEQNYSSENLKSGFLKWLEENKIRALEGNPVDMIAYIEIAKSCSDSIPYTSVIDCFPYAELKKYFESNGEKAIVVDGEGGYYDERKEESPDESYWYDPLSMKKVQSGCVGTYQYEKEHLYFGDFMEARTTKYWYGSALGDSCNEYQTDLYLQGEYVGNSNSLSMYVLEDESFPNNNVYYLTTADDVLIASVEKARIIFIHNWKMVAVAYE